MRSFYNTLTLSALPKTTTRVFVLMDGILFVLDAVSRLKRRHEVAILCFDGVCQYFAEGINMFQQALLPGYT